MRFPRTLLVVVGLTALAACAPAVEVTRFVVERAPSEHCLKHGNAAESCTDPGTVKWTLEVVLEVLDQTDATLHVPDPESGAERAYTGSQRGTELSFARVVERSEPDGGCTYRSDESIALTRNDSAVSGAERLITDEAATCNELRLQTTERRVWSWSSSAP